MAKALKTRALLTALAGLLYGASPIDVLPDVLPLLGLVDDALIVPILLGLAYFQFRKGKRLETAPVPGTGKTFDMPGHVSGRR